MFSWPFCGFRLTRGKPCSRPARPPRRPTTLSRWLVTVPDPDHTEYDRAFAVSARTKSEARAHAKRHLDLPRKRRLPVGTRLECLTRRQGALAH